MSPSRFQVLPVREIIDSRLTRPPTIHCWRVASSRQVLVSPLSRRISQTRSGSLGDHESVGARDDGAGCAVDARIGWLVDARTPPEPPAPVDVGWLVDA